jgi:uncharacterized membrane protein YgcG
MALLGLCLSVAPVLAADYASMSTEELAVLRGTMRNASQEEHAAFQQEWRNRVRQMTEAERSKYLRPPANAPRDGSGMQSGQGGPGNGPGGAGMGGQRGGGGGGRGR